MFLFLSGVMCEFCHDYFNGLLWQRITFNAYLLPEKSMDTVKVTLIVNGQLSALITPMMNGNG
jgi:hypothetical protein